MNAALVILFTALGWICSYASGVLTGRGSLGAAIVVGGVAAFWIVAALVWGSGLRVARRVRRRS